MDVVIYHNPECGTSRNVLAIIKAAGYTPTVIEYLKAGWTKPQLLGPWFPKISSDRIRAVRQNQRIIQCDVCDPAFGCTPCRQLLQVAAPA